MKTKEIWAINKKWETVKTFKSEDEIHLWLKTDPIFFQILTRVNDGPIHVLRNF